MLGMLAQPVAPGTGNYAHNPKVAGKACYAVSVAVNGEENLSSFDAGNSTPKAIEETVGLGNRNASEQRQGSRDIHRTDADEFPCLASRGPTVRLR